MLSRCDFGQVQGHQADEHAQAEAVQKTHGYQHANSHRASEQGSSNQGRYTRNGKGSFPSHGIDERSLEEGSNGESKVEQSIDGSKDAARQVSIWTTKGAR
jgi:hypothetical protein